MLSQYTPVATVPTADLGRAREFYEQTMGLSAFLEDHERGVVMYVCGEGHLLVYRSEFAGSNRATAVTFRVEIDDFDAIASDLRDQGVEFDTFDMEGGVWEDGILVGEDERAAWFRDPDGNVIALTAMRMFRG
jgi:catechol 2,3-dioxygenase-like lactoylglutathione lyase family enzyme